MNADSQGFSLIEVLITVVLVSVGVLGMAALQTRSMQITENSQQWNAATALASNMVELIQAVPQKKDSMVKALLKKDGESFDPNSVNLEDCFPFPEAKSDADYQKQRNCWLKTVSRSLFRDAENEAVNKQLLANYTHVCRTDKAGSCSDNDDAKGIEIQLAWRGRSDECSASGSVDGVDGGSVCLTRVYTDYPKDEK